MLEKIKAIFSKEASSVSFPVTKEQVKEIAKPFAYMRVWICASCKSSPAATLKIRARDDRKDGPSNFKIGLPYHELNWNGLAEEKGWETNPVKCPACMHDLTIEEYRQAKAEGRL